MKINWFQFSAIRGALLCCSLALLGPTHSSAQRQAELIGVLDDYAHYASSPYDWSIGGWRQVHAATDSTAMLHLYDRDLVRVGELDLARYDVGSYVCAWPHVLPNFFEYGESESIAVVTVSAHGVQTSDSSIWYVFVDPNDGIVASHSIDTLKFVHLDDDLFIYMIDSEPSLIHLINAEADTIYSGVARRYPTVIGSDYSGEPAFYIPAEDSASIVSASGVRFARAPLVVEPEPYRAYGEFVSSELLTFDIGDDGVPDYLVEVNKSLSGEEPTNLVVVSGGNRLIDTLVRRTSGRFDVRRFGGLLFVQDDNVPLEDLPGGSAVGYLFATDPVSGRVYDIPRPRGHSSLLQYRNRTCVHINGSDSIYFFDPREGRVIESFPKVIEFEGRPYTFAQQLNFADTVTGYGDLLYASVADEHAEGTGYLTVIAELSPVLTFSGGRNAWVTVHADGEVVAQTRSGAVGDNLRTSHFYRLLVDSTSFIDPPTPAGSVSFAPHPVGRTMRILGETADPVDVRIYSPTGQVVRAWSMALTGEELEVDLPAGLYVIELEERSGERRSSPMVVVRE